MCRCNGPGLHSAHSEDKVYYRFEAVSNSDFETFALGFGAGPPGAYTVPVFCATVDDISTPPFACQILGLSLFEGLGGFESVVLRLVVLRRPLILAVSGATRAESIIGPGGCQIWGLAARGGRPRGQRFAVGAEAEHPSTASTVSGGLRSGCLCPHPKTYRPVGRAPGAAATWYGGLPAHGRASLRPHTPGRRPSAGRAPAG